jgi:uncharacterized protein YegP (UPF0339 family)
MAGTFELKLSKRGQYMFSLKAGNHEIILTSEEYGTKSAAEHGIESVRTNSVIDGRYERKMASNDQPFFVLKAANGEPIGRSELYSSERAMEHGIDSVKRHAPEAVIKDITAAADAVAK